MSRLVKHNISGLKWHALCLTTMLVLSSITNESRADLGNDNCIAPWSSEKKLNIVRGSASSGNPCKMDYRSSSVVFRKNTAAKNNAAGIDENNVCGAQKKNTPRRTSNGSRNVQIKALANNKKQAAIVKFKVPF